MRAAFRRGEPLERLVTWAFALLDVGLVFVGLGLLLLAVLIDAPMALIARQPPLEIVATAPFLVGLVITGLTFAAAFLLIAAVPWRWVLQALVSVVWVAGAAWAALGSAK